jgi:peroxiredoxin
MEKFYKENKDKVALIGIDVGESKARVESFVRKKGILYPIALDPKGRVANLYKVRGIPTVVAVNQDGKIIYYGHSIKEMTRKVDF